MAQQAVALFGLKVSPGEEQELGAFGDVRITNIAFGETVTGKGRTVVKVHHRPVPSFDDDSDSDDEDEEDDEDGEDDEEEDEDEDEDEGPKLKKMAKASKAGAEDDEEVEDDLEDDDDDDDEEVEQAFVICSLYPGQIEQVTVDLHFSIEDDVYFSVTGDNPVEIMGNFLSPGRFDEDPDSDEVFDSDAEYDSDDEEIDSDEMELLEALNGGDDSELDDDSDDIELELDDEDDSDDDSDDDERILEFEEEDDEDGEEDEEMLPAKAIAAKPAVVNGKKRSAADADISRDNEDVTEAELAKVAKAMGLDASNLSKNQRKKLNKRLRGDDADTSADVKEEATEKAEPQKPAAGIPAKEQVKKEAKPASKKVTLPSGVIVEDIKVGSGAQAKTGNRLSMRYVGRLKTGKQFDSNTKGKPFTFKLGKGEVIGGWDEGLKGMQVGGERRLVIPPKMAYGARGAPPDIPGNSTLVFDVKLVDIK